MSIHFTFSCSNIKKENSIKISLKFFNSLKKKKKAKDDEILLLIFILSLVLLATIHQLRHISILLISGTIIPNQLFRDRRNVK